MHITLTKVDPMKERKEEEEEEEETKISPDLSVGQQWKKYTNGCFKSTHGRRGLKNTV